MNITNITQDHINEYVATVEDFWVLLKNKCSRVPKIGVSNISVVQNIEYYMKSPITFIRFYSNFESLFSVPLLKGEYICKFAEKSVFTNFRYIDVSFKKKIIIPYYSIKSIGRLLGNTIIYYEENGIEKNEAVPPKEKIFNDALMFNESNVLNDVQKLIIEVTNKDLKKMNNSLDLPVISRSTSLSYAEEKNIKDNSELKESNGLIENTIVEENINEDIKENHTQNKKSKSKNNSNIGKVFIDMLIGRRKGGCLLKIFIFFVIVLIGNTIIRIDNHTFKEITQTKNSVSFNVEIGGKEEAKNEMFNIIWRATHRYSNTNKIMINIYAFTYDVDLGLEFEASGKYIINKSDINSINNFSSKGDFKNSLNWNNRLDNFIEENLIYRLTYEQAKKIVPGL